MAAFAWKLFCIITLFNAACSGNVKLIHISETVCFQTVTHYYSNPSITGKSVLYFSYKNDFQKSIVINITCPNMEKDLFLHLESIRLAMPANIDEFCVESKATNFTDCKLSSQCDCCVQPKGIYTLDISNIENYRKSCDGKKQCGINVNSQFFEDCFMKTYKCHSRWAEVSYTCRPMYDDTSTMITFYDHLTISGDHGQSKKSLWWVWLLFGGMTAVFMCTVAGFVIYLKRNTKMQENGYNDTEASEPLNGNHQNWDKETGKDAIATTYQSTEKGKQITTKGGFQRTTPRRRSLQITNDLEKHVWSTATIGYRHTR